MKFRIIVVFLLFALGYYNPSFSQLDASTIGSAVDLGGNCYSITPDQLDQAGGVWYNNSVDFAEDFTIYYQAFFGTKDADGADGSALVFKGTPNPVIGGSGGGIGFAGITPSLIIEFDTFQNISPFNNNDPVSDHIAIIRDGDPDHGQPTNLSGPVQASSTSTNIEDGLNHEVQIQWEAAAQTLSVYFDCVLRLTLTEDIQNTIFLGDNTIFFGFVASTGGLSNSNEVCFNSITFVENLLLEDEVLCIGESLDTVDATIPSGVTYSWSPITGVSDPNIPNPIFSPSTTTTYTVTIEDICGETTTENFTLNTLPIETPLFDAVPPICAEEDLTALPTTSNNGITGSWSPALNNTVTTTYTFTPSSGECATETTLEVTVIPNTVPIFDAIMPICPGDILPPLPTTSNNGITGSWSPALNNMATTMYTFIPNPGQGCVAETSTEIVVQGIIPEFEAVGAICAGETLQPLPTLSNNGIAGSWSPALNNTATTVYTFTPNAGECAFPTTLEIVITPISTLEVDASVTSENFDDRQTIEVIVTGGIPPYEFRLNDGAWQESNVFERVEGCAQTVFVRQVNECSDIPETSVLVLTYPKFFTPNGDPYNDTWNIFCLENDPLAQITIFDRYGKLLTRFPTTSFGWDGRFNNIDMPSEDYWFVLEYEDQAGVMRTFSSHFSLKR
ncbi:lectin-like domain-containing protein [Flagellimonas allohymeniacidonis]|uniref:T9SS type B sorting domain-containing protein n=1 Tax=Flagellimonas allohymeniacidonis TaxID=2517819 RepID=A0A4Q8QHZ4_9FLAO|nr:T9SS type B sorting domain-containing protein [Allomuricauda hymeniacidonis]TAI49594.1 T9SS type B sorting domain-containing protein [Allomuricauda hymeniacidonis]